MTREEELKIERGYARFELWMKKHPRKRYPATELIQVIAGCYEIPFDQASEIVEGLCRLAKRADEAMKN
jgi:hypothetical protein